MRRAAKVDLNQRAIVDALRKAGATVQSLASVGRGCPDLLVGYHGRNFLFEVKRDDVPPSKRRLTEDEQIWHQAWGGDVRVIKSFAEAYEMMRIETQLEDI